MAAAFPILFVQGQGYTYEWSNVLVLIGIALSMTVNALVTGLIVFRIFKVFREFKTAAADNQTSGVPGGGIPLQRVIFILIESGVALFLIQLTRLVVAIVPTDEASNDAFYFITGIHEMLNVIMMIDHCYVILLITWAS